MLKMFGPASASRVDEMSELDCVQQCRKKVGLLLGEGQVLEFDALFQQFSGESELPVSVEGKKHQCQQIMLELFGPASAAKVDAMTEADCVQKCQEKVRSLLGDKHAERFDRL